MWRLEKVRERRELGFGAESCELCALVLFWEFDVCLLTFFFFISDYMFFVSK